MNVMIVGGGKVGRYLTSLLVDQHMVKLIEMRPDHMSLVEAEVPKAVAVQGNGTDPLLLESAGFGSAMWWPR
ncbi:MAG: NAD-binding protein [Caldilineaceae bacterium]